LVERVYGQDLPHYLGQSKTLVFLGAKKRGSPNEEKGNNHRKAKPVKTARRNSHAFKCSTGEMKER